MLAFINTPALAMSLALHTLDEGVQESHQGQRRARRARRRSVRASGRTGRRDGWLARSLHLAH